MSNISILLLFMMFGVIIGAALGTILGAVVALFTKENKLKKFKNTLRNTTIIVTLFIMFMASVSW